MGACWIPTPQLPTAHPHRRHTFKTRVGDSSVPPPDIALSVCLSPPAPLSSGRTWALTTKSPAIKAVEPGCAQQFFRWESWVPVSTSTTVASPSPADDVSNATSLILFVRVRAVGGDQRPGTGRRVPPFLRIREATWMYPCVPKGINRGQSGAPLPSEEHREREKELTLLGNVCPNCWATCRSTAGFLIGLKRLSAPQPSTGSGGGVHRTASSARTSFPQQEQGEEWDLSSFPLSRRRSWRQSRWPASSLDLGCASSPSGERGKRTREVYTSAS